ncbi:MAG: hypothetical protein AAF515_04575 [Pseudomonadota bacterium]
MSDSASDTEDPMPSEGDSEHRGGVAPWCLATVVADKALAALLESGGTPRFKDDAPWLLAKTEFERAAAANLRVPLLLLEDPGLAWRYWCLIDSIDVLELSGKRFASEVTMTALREITPLFRELDSVLLRPDGLQIAREAREGVRMLRHPVTEAYVRPYAFCETPGFIPGLTAWQVPQD